MDDGCSFPVIVVVIIAAVIFLVMCSSNTNAKADYVSEYNDGICQDCGGTLIYQQAIGHKDSTAYIFQCDKCNNIIEIDSYDVKDKVIYFTNGETRPATTYATEEEFSDEYKQKHQDNNYDVCNGSFDYEG